MNKGELIEKVVKATGLSKSDVSKTINATIETITKSLKKGEKVSLAGFGTFSVVKSKARKGRNPRTGEILKIRAKKSPKFKAGKTLKDIIAGVRKIKK